jgi:hypothetical protein
MKITSLWELKQIEAILFMAYHIYQEHYHITTTFLASTLQFWYTFFSLLVPNFCHECFPPNFYREIGFPQKFPTKKSSAPHLPRQSLQFSYISPPDLPLFDSIATSLQYHSHLWSQVWLILLWMMLTSWSCSPPFASTSSRSSRQSDPPALDPHHLTNSWCSTENDSIIPYGMPCLIPSLSSSWQFNWILIYSSSQFKESSSNPSTCVQSKHHLCLPPVNPSYFDSVYLS